MNTLAALTRIPDRKTRFHEMCRLYSAYAREEGIAVRPFLSPAVPKFAALPATVQERVTAMLATELEIFEEVRAEGHSLRDTPRLLWRSMSRLGLVPQSDIFDKIGEGDIVEIYLVDATSQRQVFRNLKFMEFTSFTLEEIFGAEWKIATSREEKYERQLHEAAVSILTGRIDSTVDPGVDAHVFVEVGSPDLLTVRIKVKYMSPVRSEGRVVGLLAVNHSELLGSQRAAT